MIIEYVGGVVSVGLISYIVYTRRKLQRYTACKQTRTEHKSIVSTYVDFYLDGRFPVGVLPPIHRLLENEDFVQFGDLADRTINLLKVANIYLATLDHVTIYEIEEFTSKLAKVYVLIKQDYENRINQVQTLEEIKRTEVRNKSMDFLNILEEISKNES